MTKDVQSQTTSDPLPAACTAAEMEWKMTGGSVMTNVVMGIKAMAPFAGKRAALKDTTTTHSPAGRKLVSKSSRKRVMDVARASPWAAVAMTILRPFAIRHADQGTIAVRGTEDAPACPTFIYVKLLVYQ